MAKEIIIRGIVDDICDAPSDLNSRVILNIIWQWIVEQIIPMRENAADFLLDLQRILRSLSPLFTVFKNSLNSITPIMAAFILLLSPFPSKSFNKSWKYFFYHFKNNSWHGMAAFKGPMTISYQWKFWIGHPVKTERGEGHRSLGKKAYNGPCLREI